MTHTHEVIGETLGLLTHRPRLQLESKLDLESHHKSVHAWKLYR